MILAFIKLGAVQIHGEDESRSAEGKEKSSAGASTSQERPRPCWRLVDQSRIAHIISSFKNLAVTRVTDV